MAGVIGNVMDAGFGGYNDPSKNAMSYLDQIPDQLKQYLMPYINAGSKATSQLPDIYGNMLDPNALMGKIGAGYSASPGYEWQLGQGTQAINNAASAGGMVGTPQHQQQEAQMAEGLANQDYYNYLGKALGLYGQGAEGMAGLSGQGFKGAGELGEGISQYLTNASNIKYAGDMGENIHNQANQGAFWGFLSSLISGGGDAAKAAAMA